METIESSTHKAAARRPAALIFIHWGTLLAILTAVVIILFREAMDEKAVRMVLLDIHRNAGLLVLLGTLARIALRVRHHPLEAVEPLPRLQHLVAGATHFALYGLMLALPVLGWLLSSAHGHAVNLFGLIHLPDLVERDGDMADNLEELHALAAWALAAIVAVHAAAALWHHFIRRDGVLRAMLPAARGGRA